jgi:dienelactone hydrolase/predicted Ser/Thr protein kinase
MSLSAGDRLGPYEIVARLGAGGMGEVYEAIDTRLGRKVAIKVSLNEFSGRFDREARAAAALNHPNVCSIFDVGPDYIVMEYLEGSTLSKVLRQGALPAARIRELALQIMDGLQAAHSAGIIHRDLKPSNIWITTRGDVKILDFGIAKIAHAAAMPTEESPTADASLTLPGAVIGTLAYMSPEQALGRQVDARSDLFSAGTVLYEMATGARPFHGDTDRALLVATVHDSPAPASTVNSEIPSGLAAVIAKCLEKDPAARYPSAAAVHQALERLAATRKPVALGVALAILLILIGPAVWFKLHLDRVRWAHDQALPQIVEAQRRGQYFAAVALARRANEYIPSDPILQGLWPQISRIVTIESTPSGAEVFHREYSAVNSPWESLGRTPLAGIRIPHGYSLWKLSAPGYVTLEFSGGLPEVQPPPRPPERLRVALQKQDGPTADSVLVPDTSGAVIRIPGLEGFPQVDLPAYYLDRYEVSNREFKRFVAAGGYQKPEFWKQPFTEGARTVPWAAAMQRFVDRTGKPGPAGWELSDYPAGQDDFPVVGVSWYEAAAYAEFVHKRLPTAYHWSEAASPRMGHLFVPLSNFGGASLTARSASRAVGPSGAFDMAGNAKEWCWNASGEGRLILGGGYNEPAYMFNDWDSKPAFARQLNFGIRLMQPAGGPVPAASEVPVPTAMRDYRKEKPASDALFAVYRSQYSYDPAPLNPASEPVQETDDWRMEKVSYHAGYGDERIYGLLLLPKHAAPPYQVAIEFPGAGNLHERGALQPEHLIDFRRVGYLPKSGRALLMLAIKGTHDRGDKLQSDHPTPTALYRDHVIMWSKELRRTVDYIETRHDLDASRIAYYGFSWGGALGALLPALEPRLKVLVLDSGGLYAEKTLPEVDQINFASRIRIPVLMVGGRYDQFFPVETSQQPLLRLFGAPENEKRLVVEDGSHPVPLYVMEREALAWLDRFLGTPAGVQ